MSRRVRVHLHGALAVDGMGPIEIVATTAWEVIEGLSRQLETLKPNPIRGRRVLQVLGFDTEESLKQTLQVDELHLMPPLVFGKRGGLFQIIIGAVLVVVGVALTVLGNPLGAMLLQTGVMMIIGGLVQLLSPVPQLNGGDDESKRSKYLPSQVNTVRIGTPIPILYGYRRVAGHILSINIDAKDTGL